MSPAMGTVYLPGTRESSAYITLDPFKPDFRPVVDLFPPAVTCRRAGGGRFNGQAAITRQTRDPRRHQLSFGCGNCAPSIHPSIHSFREDSSLLIRSWKSVARSRARTFREEACRVVFRGPNRCDEFGPAARKQDAVPTTT